MGLVVHTLVLMASGWDAKHSLSRSTGARQWAGVQMEDGISGTVMTTTQQENHWTVHTHWIVHTLTHTQTHTTFLSAGSTGALFYNGKASD